MVDQGNEGIDVKEGCLRTSIEGNIISMQHDENAGGKLVACRCRAHRWKSGHDSRGETVARTDHITKQLYELEIALLSIWVNTFRRRADSDRPQINEGAGIRGRLDHGSGAHAVANARRLYSGE